MHTTNPLSFRNGTHYNAHAACPIFWSKIYSTYGHLPTCQVRSTHFHTATSFVQSRELAAPVYCIHLCDARHHSLTTLSIFVLYILRCEIGLFYCPDNMRTFYSFCFPNVERMCDNERSVPGGSSIFHFHSFRKIVRTNEKSILFRSSWSRDSRVNSLTSFLPCSYKLEMRTMYTHVCGHLCTSNGLDFTYNWISLFCHSWSQFVFFSFFILFELNVLQFMRYAHC